MTHYPDIVTTEGNLIRPAFGQAKVTTAVSQPVEQERYVFTCECGCRSYNMFSDGTIGCTYCDTIITPCDSCNAHGDWRKCVDGVSKVETPGVETKDDGDTFNKHDFPTADFARHAVMRNFQQWADEDKIRYIHASHEDGTSQSWHNFETEEQRAWVLRRMDEAKVYVEGLKLIDAETTLEDVAEAASE